MLSLVLAMMLQAAGPAPEPPRPSIITNPDWERRPNGAQMGSRYPKAAIKNDLAGEVSIACNTSSAGILVECAVIRETPLGVGFGDAALSVAKLFRMKPMLRDGRPIEGGMVQIPLRFVLPLDLRSAVVTVRDQGFSDGRVELNCRYRDFHLDNCLTHSGRPQAAMLDAAIKLAEGVTLPPMPRAQGRIIVPLKFVSSEGRATSGLGAPTADTATPMDVLANPRWIRTPAAEDFARLYPESASARGLSGSTRTVCKITTTGTLTDCTNEKEEPAGQGFAEASIRMMAFFKLQPVDASGVSASGKSVRIPLRWVVARGP